MAKQGNEPPDGKPAVDDRALDLLRRSSTRQAAAEVGSRSAAVNPFKPAILRPPPVTPPDQEAAPLGVEPEAAPAEENPEAAPGENEPRQEKGVEIAAALPPDESSETPEAEAEAEPERGRRRWVAALLLLLLLLGGGASWVVMRQPDDDDKADSMAAGQTIGPAVSLGGQKPPEDPDQNNESGRNAGGPGNAAAPSRTPLFPGTLPLAPSGTGRPGDADYRFAEPGAPGSPLSPETARLQAIERGGGVPSSASPPGRPGGPSSGTQSSSAGAGGGGSPAGSGPASSSGGGSASAASGGSGAGSPPPGRPPRAIAAVAPSPPMRQRAARLLDPAAPETCPETPKEPVVLVFDGSVSMGLPIDMSVDLEAALDRRMDQGDEEARLEYRRWLASDRPKRLDYGKDAVRTLLRDADPKLNFGAVAFTACNEIASRPFVTVDGRPQLANFIGNVTPHRGGNTALVDSIEAALSLLQEGGGRTGRIILLTDGKETCGGDLCALAERIGKDRPGIRVDVVDLSGLSNTSCIAEATGGVVLTYAETRALMPLSRLLVRAANQCIPR